MRGTSTAGTCPSPVPCQTARSSAGEPAAPSCCFTGCKHPPPYDWGLQEDLNCRLCVTVASTSLLSPRDTSRDGQEKRKLEQMHSQTSPVSLSCLQQPAGTCSSGNFHVIKATYGFLLCNSIFFLPFLNFWHPSQPVAERIFHTTLLNPPV